MKKSLVFTIGVAILGLSNFQAHALPLGIPTTGLVAYYTFGGNANDLSGNGNHGILFGGPDYGADRFSNLGQALSLDGDDYVKVLHNASLNMTNSFTIAAWINLTTYTEWASVATKGQSANNYTMNQSGPAGLGVNGRFRFTADAPGLPINPYIESLSPVPLNEWHHVTMTYDGSFIRFYLDGAINGASAFSSTLNTNTESLFIGVNFLNGFLDEVAIYDQALSVFGIKAVMNPSTLAPPGPGSSGISPVPEPSTLVLLGLGSLGLFGFLRKKRKS